MSFSSEAVAFRTVDVLYVVVGTPSLDVYAGLFDKGGKALAAAMSEGFDRALSIRDGGGSPAVGADVAALAARREA